LSYNIYVVSSLQIQFHWLNSWDSGKFIDPFILVYN